eukprot:c18254_g2_i1 orf=350-2206(-)
MPSERDYSPAYVKADTAFQQNDTSYDESSGSPSDPSELTSSPRVSHDNLQASSSSPRSLSWRRAILSPGKAFHILKQSKEELSLLTPSAPSSATNAEGFNLPLVGQVKWEDLKKATKEWLKDPKNLAVCLWGLAVGISGAVLFLVMVGLLDKQLPSKKERDAWFEVNNQILNALFTMMCLYLHPQRCLHLVMLLRWRPQDISKLRQVYCKNGTYKPHEWMHMLVVVSLLHINCFSQYALCSLNWGFKRSQRPPVGVGLCLAVAIGAPAAAGIYSILSPLGKDFYIDEENDVHMREATLTLGRTPSIRIGRAPWIFCGDFSLASKDGALVDDPRWKGGLFDCCEDPPVAVLSTVCPFCVFGWNMERLGFGNRYVHIVTFILLCTAPYWILTLAAINIDNVQVRKGLGISGILLSIFGLLYGGFWRIQMRKTYKLPAGRWCFGKTVLTDCTQWLFCGLCSLCQEVRTSEYYRIRESNFYERRALSEISSIPSFSGRHSPRAFDFGTEASSPVSFRANYAPAPYSYLSEIRVAAVGKIEASEDGQGRVVSDLSPRGPMHPPTVQILQDKGSNYHSVKSLASFNTDSPHYSDKTFKSSQQRGGSPEVICNRDQVLHDRSNKL